jgi:hypothetical protein
VCVSISELLSEASFLMYVCTTSNHVDIILHGAFQLTPIVCRARVMCQSVVMIVQIKYGSDLHLHICFITDFLRMKTSLEKNEL